MSLSLSLFLPLSLKKVIKKKKKKIYNIDSPRALSVPRETIRVWGMISSIHRNMEEEISTNGFREVIHVEPSEGTCRVSY